MSWFDTKNFASLAKTALKEAQKKIDKVLDIQEDELEASKSEGTVEDNSAESTENPITTELKRSMKKLPGVANRSESTDEVKYKEIDDSSLLVSTSSPELSGETFLKTSERKEMITIAPKAGNITKEIEAISKTAIISPVSIDPPRKRSSVASTLESVDVLSPPQISPCSDETVDISQSVELITATSDMITSGSEQFTATATSDSIVIIDRSSDAGLDADLCLEDVESARLDDLSNLNSKTIVENLEGKKYFL